MARDSESRSPKRRRTSSRASSHSSAPSSPRLRHQLPLRRAASPERRRRYSSSRSRDRSRDNSLTRDHTSNRDGSRSPSNRRRSRSDTAYSSARSEQTRSRTRTRSPSVHSSASSSSPSHADLPPSPSPLPKRLAFRPLFTLARAHLRGITSVKFSPDGALLATASGDSTIHIYSVSPSNSSEPCALLKTLRGHLAGINALAWSPLPPYTLASASDDKTILLWAPTGSSDLPIAPSPLLGHHNYVYSLAFSPKGNMLVSGSHDEAVFLWDVRSARVMRSLPAHSDPVGGVDFLLDGTMVCSCAGDGLIRLWDSSTGQCLKTLVDEDRKPVTSVRFTPNGKFVLAWTLDGCVRLWNYIEGTCVKTYQGHVNSQYSLSGTVGRYECAATRAHDGGVKGEAFVASGSEDGHVIVWDVSSKEILWRGTGHSKPVLDVDFCRTPDGRGLLASGGLDKDIRLWIEVDEHGSEVMNKPIIVGDDDEAGAMAPALTNGMEGVEAQEDDEMEDA